MQCGLGGVSNRGRGCDLDRHNTSPLGAANCAIASQAGKIGSTYRSVCSLEAVELGLGAALVLVLWDLRLQDLCSQGPKLLVIIVEKHDDASGLGVEGRGNVKDDLVDEVGNLLVALRGRLVQGVKSSALLDGVEESLGGSHGG